MRLQQKRECDDLTLSNSFPKTKKNIDDSILVNICIITRFVDRVTVYTQGSSLEQN